MSVSVGEKVQVKGGGIDVTNGVKAKAGKMYGEGGPLFGEVKQIVENWSTGGKYGLPKTITKVRIADAKGTIVWQVRLEDIAGNKVTEEPPAPPPPEPEPVESKPNPEPVMAQKEERVSEGVETTLTSYAMEYGSNNWDRGAASVREVAYSTAVGNAKAVSVATAPSNIESTSKIRGSELVGQQEDPELGELFFPGTGTTGAIYKQKTVKTKFDMMISDGANRDRLLNEDATIIQNSSGYPAKVAPANGMYAAKYDYRFIPGDTRYPNPGSLEDKLMQFRRAAGIQVHGSQEIAKSVKMYMYNRFKTPDTNMSQTKMVTHIFFTRPDLYLMDSPTTACAQAMNHTDSAMMWRRYPELFKLLTHRARCNDENNFNMLLSNQIQSFNLHDEKISTKDAGHSWTKQVMTYGDSYTGRMADTFDCTFLETNELSVINLIKLWMTYIDNVHTGAWSPNYTNGQCHVHDRALDYAASVYVFKCGVDGEDILYWSKYYGVFPITTGAAVLSWENGETSKLLTPTIEFAYSFKKDLSPVSLLEFNDNAAIFGSQVYASSYDQSINSSTRPYVGTPYIELDLGEPALGPNNISTGKKTQIRLKFKGDVHPMRSDTNLFRANSSLSNIQNPVSESEKVNVTEETTKDYKDILNENYIMNWRTKYDQSQDSISSWV